MKGTLERILEVVYVNLGKDECKRRMHIIDGSMKRKVDVSGVSKAHLCGKGAAVSGCGNETGM